jgi:hypothetical protein
MWPPDTDASYGWSCCAATCNTDLFSANDLRHAGHAPARLIEDAGSTFDRADASSSFDHAVARARDCGSFPDA